MLCHLHPFQLSDTSIQLWIPDAGWVQQQYQQQLQAGKAVDFPYWAQVWPAAKALAAYIAINSALVQNKQVVEMAAGLGLPGLTAARFASRVIISDYIEAPLHLVKKSATENKFTNVHCSILNWNNADADPNTEVLLLSDINYDPTCFDKLLSMLHQFLQAGTTILLSTPHRIAGKTFIEMLKPWVVNQQLFAIPHQQQSVDCSVYHLQH
jgi:methyltransferase-like protein 23